MSLYTALKNGVQDTLSLERSLDGNLCRCTGYRPLLDAARSFGSDFAPLSTESPFCNAAATSTDSESEVAQLSTPPLVKSVSQSVTASAPGGPGLEMEGQVPSCRAEAQGRLQTPLRLQEPVARTMRDGSQAVTEWHRPASIAELARLLAYSPQPLTQVPGAPSPALLISFLYLCAFFFIFFTPSLTPDINAPPLHVLPSRLWVGRLILHGVFVPDVACSWTPVPSLACMF